MSTSHLLDNCIILKLICGMVACVKRSGSGMEAGLGFGRFRLPLWGNPWEWIPQLSLADRVGWFVFSECQKWVIL
jgi:hypothetical protein